MNDDNTMTILMEDYKNLQERSVKLAALESAGVDNWDGYYLAMKIYHESYPID